jgi:hypothetical protein
MIVPCLLFFVKFHYPINKQPIKMMFGYMVFHLTAIIPQPVQYLLEAFIGVLQIKHLNGCNNSFPHSGQNLVLPVSSLIISASQSWQ